MGEKSLIDKVLITLEVGNRTSLFILLTQNGTIHRKGNGSTVADLPLRRGLADQDYFGMLMLTIDESLFQHTGLVKMPDIVGEECQLTLVFQGQRGLDFGFRVVYGLDSQGPPAELAQILINAVKLTENWYQNQLQEQDGNTSTASKKWWQFWK